MSRLVFHCAIAGGSCAGRRTPSHSQGCWARRTSLRSCVLRRAHVHWKCTGRTAQPLPGVVASALSWIPAPPPYRTRRRPGIAVRGVPCGIPNSSGGPWHRGLRQEHARCWAQVTPLHGRGPGQSSSARHERRLWRPDGPLAPSGGEEAWHEDMVVPNGGMGRPMFRGCPGRAGGRTRVRAAEAIDEVQSHISLCGEARAVGRILSVRGEEGTAGPHAASPMKLRGRRLTESRSAARWSNSDG
jgi:hypothetical protein